MKKNTEERWRVKNDPPPFLIKIIVKIHPFPKFDTSPFGPMVLERGYYFDYFLTYGNPVSGLPSNLK